MENNRMKSNTISTVVLFLTTFVLSFCANRSFSDDAPPPTDVNNATEKQSVSLVEEFGLLTKLEDEIDWSGLAARLDIKTPPFADYERLLFDSVSWFNPFESGLPATEAGVSDLLIQKRYDEAFECYMKAWLAGNSQGRIGAENVGHVYSNMGDTEKAESLYRRIREKK